jgi:eukaryotic-like serine/threonine-protein kinase
MGCSVDDFRSSRRFRTVNRLGSGGMGIVYEVLDVERNQVVALKTLRSSDASAIYRLKREFRTLAGIAHPHLVALYELFGDQGQWYFTMEFVPGCEFLEYVRPDGLDVGRLRSALGQIAEGLMAIHDVGKLHRDLKPANIRVTPEGRVVILDFGLSADVIRADDAVRTMEEGVWGTAEYMAPEQGDGQAMAASDWYALGCMLYEALTGRLPYQGKPLALLVDKRLEDPPRPDVVTAGLPPDLVALCLDLLARSPEHRPDGTDVLRRLGVTQPQPRSGRASRQPPDLYVGRVRELGELEQAFAAVQPSDAVAVLVHGPSGIGKSALVRRFLRRVTSDRRGVVLTGRCYVRESMPYKGLDGVVDSLTRFLRTLSGAQLAPLIGLDVRSAVALFPVLGRVEKMWSAPPSEEQSSDPVQLRRQRFAAFRDLLRRISSAQPLVVHIDDLQWSDPDSVALLHSLLEPPDPPALLLVASFSTEDSATQPLLHDLLGRIDGARWRELRVGPLSEEDTGRLAQGLLGDHAAENGKPIAAIVQEAGGNPFLVEQLVRYLQVSDQEQRAGRSGLTLGDVIAARLAQLPSSARAFLETLAVAGRPIEAVVARDVAGLSGDERPLVALLEAEHWLRPASSVERVEVYHDRLRRELASLIEPTRLPNIHLRLANAIEARRSDDPEALYEHYAEAGELECARSCAIRAGDKAAHALAFERAAWFYRRALELVPDSRADAGRLYSRLGDALANAGRIRDAADAFARAAEAASPQDALELRRRAAEQLLIGGRIEEGLEMLQTVLAAAGLKLAKTHRRALLGLLYRRVRLRLRGLGFVERAPADISPAVLTKIDVCRTVSEGLAHLDTIRATDFQTRHLLLSLDAGEPDRIARALALEAGFVALVGSRVRRRSDRLLAEAKAVAERIRSPHARGLCSMIVGITAYFRGDFVGSRDAMMQAERLLLEHGVGVAWELVTARLYHTLSLFYLGDVPELTRCAEAYLRDAAARGNRFAGMMYRSGATNVTWLAADRVEGARQALSEALAEWPAEPFRTPHYMAMMSAARIHLYAGEPKEAWRQMSRSWPAFERAGLRRIQAVRIASSHLRGSCAVAASRALPTERAHLLRVAEHEVRAMVRERSQWGLAFASLVRAAIASCRSDPASAGEHLRDALAGFEGGEMLLFVAAARRRLGELLGGDKGQALVTRANAWMAARGIANPDRMTAMLAPGFP